MSDNKAEINPTETPQQNVGDVARPDDNELFANGILVLGMHRSGTSAVAGMLRLMGAYLGNVDELLPAHPQDNPGGYWERAELNAAHDDFLDRNGYSWNRLAGFDPLAPEGDSGAALSSKINSLIAQMDAGGLPWIAKDPRLCLLLPYWQMQLGEAACVVVVRDPREIATSMRSGPRGVFGSPYVIALWEKYLRTLLTSLNGRRAIFVAYAGLLENPLPESTRLLHGLQAIGVDGLHAPNRQELASFLDAKLRRSVPSPHLRLSAEQESLYAWLHVQCRAPGPVLVSGFPQNDDADASLAEFEQAFSYHLQLGRAQATTESALRLAEVRQELDETRHQRNVTAAELEIAQHQTQALTGNLDALHSQHEQLREKFAESEQRLTASETQVRVQNAALDETNERHLATVRELDETKQRHLAIVRELDETKQRHLAAVRELDEVRHARNIAALRSEQNERRIDDLSRSIDAMRSSWSWKLTAPLRRLANLFTFRFSSNLEQHLYRAYYALPGVGPARKRAFILWMHARIPWLTGKTLSYRLLKQTPAAPTATDTAILVRMDQARANTAIAGLTKTPATSIVMPVYNVEARWLIAAVDSVRRQFYPHWELCIADDASTNHETRKALDEIVRLGDNRIRVAKLKRNSGIAHASNAALKLATGDYVGLLDHDDALTRDALLEVAMQIAASNADILYSDEDKLDEAGQHVEVHCKPDFSPDYFFSINYICHFSVFRRDLLTRIGGFRTGFDGAQDYDLLLRATEKTENIAHISKVLYHWRRIPGSTAATSTAKPQTSDAGRRALAESIRRRGIKGSVETGPYPNTFRVRRTIVGEPLVSILIPFRDKPDLLDVCVSSILSRTRYANFEILCIDNGSREPETRAVLDRLSRQDARVRLVRHDAPFNYSAINNFGAAQARGAHLLFLNNDTEVISDEWLGAMIEHSQRPEVGVVGARLWYADRTIQHAGVIVGPGGVAGHGHLFQPGDDPGYFARIRLVQNLSAVTFACAMTRREVFTKLGGLNERELKIAFNDVDYCLRAREAGFLVVYTPYALLHHYESKSRGYEDTPEKQMRFAGEIHYMQQRHAVLFEHGDPYYNPRLSLTNSFQPDQTYAAELPR